MDITELTRKILDRRANESDPLRIVQAGHPALRRKAVNAAGRIDVGLLSELAEAMTITMHKAPGVGLAAPQIGLPLRFYVVEDSFAAEEGEDPDDDLLRSRLASTARRAPCDRSASGDEHIEHRGRIGATLDRLPVSRVLETLSFRVHSVAFVCWTFTLICGSIWAREALGRYWGWDPKEVWTFVIWVLYAAYLHARATGGFRRNRAAGLALAGFVAVVFNYTIVNTVINGLHSYSGL